MSEIDWDDAYANGAHIAGAEEFPPRWAARAAAFRDALLAKGKCELNIAYGPGDREQFDLFLPDAAPRGLVVFVHGGYWRQFDRASWSHLAEGALSREYAVAMPSYTLVPDISISGITRQVARAIDRAAGMVAGPIYLTGHSAGGHLVTRMLCSDISWSVCFNERIKKVVSISGVHDLRPLLKTALNDDLRLDAAEAEAESPLLRQDVVPVPVVAWVGGGERPVFIDQSTWLARDWEHARLEIDPGKHHFDVIDGLAEADTPLTKALLG